MNVGRPCEYCGTALPLGVDKRTRRIRTAHFASCAMRPKRMEVESPRREWRGLDEGALMGLYIDFDRSADKQWSSAEYVLRLMDMVQARLKEKNT